MSTTSLSRRIVAAALMTLAVLGLLLARPARASAVGGGYIRLAHLVPDNIPCDMYIQLNSVDGKVLKSLPSVKYGTVSDYQLLPVGTYAVSMRKPGDPVSARPVLSTSVTVSEGRAYTVARIGAPGKPEARVIEDDRALPSGNQAKVRVLQAAQRTVDVTVADGGVTGGVNEGVVSGVNGGVIARSVAFATATGYQGVDAGDRTLRVQPAGGQLTTVHAKVAAGSVYSLLVLEGANGAVAAELRTDAKREGAVPRGGVETGAGGSQRTNPLPILVGGLVLLVLYGAAARGQAVVRCSTMKDRSRTHSRAPASATLATSSAPTSPVSKTRSHVAPYSAGGSTNSSQS